MSATIEKFRESVNRLATPEVLERDNFPLNGLCGRVSADKGIKGFWEGPTIEPTVGGAVYAALPQGEQWGDTIALVSCQNETLACAVNRDGALVWLI